MTREERRRQDSEIYLAENVPDRYRKYFGYIKLAFEAGAEWSDNNPDLSSLWHDASEEPEQGRLMLGIESNYAAIYKWIGQDPKGWTSFIKDTGLSKWAYIDDLLPKGGEK